MRIKRLLSKTASKIYKIICYYLNRDHITFHKVYAYDSLIKLGTEYGGWVIPENLLNSNSVCYCVGCGEDISFDLSLINKFSCDVFAFDPTPRAIQYVNKVAGSNHKYHFFQIGLWNKDDILKFYAPKLSDHVSHSVLNLQKTEQYFEAQVKKLSAIMQENGHDQLDLLKLDIEGAEYNVVNSIIEDSINIKILCIEYDEYFNPLDGAYRQRIKTSINKLLNAGFELVFTQENGNYTFVNKS
jgi:FkbM family methyltransferase